MPTTTMALSSPSNVPSTLPGSSQISKDEALAMSDKTEAAQLLTPNGGDTDDILKTTVNGNNLKNGGVSSLLTGEHSSPKMPFHSPITIGTSSLLSSTEIDVDLNIKGPTDMSCLNVVTSSGASNNHYLNGNNGHLLMAQSGGASLNFQASNSPDSPWSIGEVENSGFVNYSSTNNGQMHKRPIMSQQPHHGLSPNSSIGRNNASQQQQQQYIHYNKNNGNNSNNYSAAWSNSGQNSPWQQQQQMQHQQQLLHQSSSQASITNWNRGRSVPNLNPMNVPPHQRKNLTQYAMPPSASSSQGLSPNPNSPTKYRRSTSYPGKNQNMHGYQMAAVDGIIEDQTYMTYQVS